MKLVWLPSIISSWWLFFTNPSKKYAKVKLDQFCPNRDESTKYLKPPSNHHLGSIPNSGFQYWRFRQVPMVSWLPSPLLKVRMSSSRILKYKKNNPVLCGWWFQPIWKILVKMEIFPNFRSEHKKYLKAPGSYVGNPSLWLQPSAEKKTKR